MNDQIIKSKINALPSLNISMDKVLNLINQMRPQPMDVLRIIRLDPILTAKVLSFFHASSDGQVSKDNTLAKAIILLGMTTIRNILLNTIPNESVRKQFNEISLFSMPENYWLHSVATAVLSKLIGGLLELTPHEKEEYFLAGLVHGIGKLGLGFLFPNDYNQAVDKAKNENQYLLQAEQFYFNHDHSTLGAIIVETWQLAPLLKQVVQYYHQPHMTQVKYRHCVYAVGIANRFVSLNKIGFSGDVLQESIPAEWLSFLNLKETDLTKLIPSLNKRIRNILNVMGIQ